MVPLLGALMSATLDSFWGLGNTEWTALSALAGGIYDLLTLALVIFAVVQIISARKEARINRTIAACDRYDFDPSIDAVCRRLSEARDSGDLNANPRKYRLDLYSLLNYLEGIAIGVDRGLYHRDVLKDFMQPIFIGCIEEYITSGLVTRAAPDVAVAGSVASDDYDRMIALVKGWSHVPWYRGGLMSAKPKI
jgi:hypothetical protein